MFDPKMSAADKHAKARSLFDHVSGHYARSLEEKRSASAFVAGRQWQHEELKYLRNQRRPALTFNVTAGKVHTIIGMNEDHRREAVAQPESPEDMPTAEALNSILGNLRRDLDLDALDSQVYEQGIVEGEGFLHLDVDRDPKRPDWVRLTGTPVSSQEVYFDPSADRDDRADARYLFWYRWVTKEEFKLEYPEHASKADFIFSSEHTDGSEYGPSTIHDENDYQAPIAGRWTNRRRGEMRVVHMEYKVPIKRFFVVAPGREPVPVDAATARQMRSRAQAPAFEGVEVVDQWDEEVRWLEFYFEDVLFDDVAPVPFDGFSIKTFPVYMDRETAFTYGHVRNLMDPQRDVNKAYSQSLEHIVAQSKPGYIAEEGAVPDREQFEEANDKAGSVSLVEDGALTQGRIQERRVPEYSSAAAGRLQSSLELFDRISGVLMDAESPARAVEAAATVQLREKKALRSMQQVLRNFWRFQIDVAQCLTEIVSRAMPDDQIQALLSQEQRYQASQMGIIDVNAQAPIELRNLRKLRYQIDLQPSERSDTERLMQLDLLLKMSATNPNIPVDPQVVLDLASQSKVVRERLKSYAQQAAQSMAQQGQEQQAMVAQQLQLAAQGQQQKFVHDMTKLGETERHNRVAEQQDARDSANDALIEILAIWEKADEAEKRRIQEQLRSARSEGLRVIQGGTP